MEWNRVKYIDCLDEKEGLPSLPDKSIDLCFTDPPYGNNFKGKKKYPNKNTIYFKDDYSFDWQIEWFEEILRICKGVIFTPGNTYFFDWIRYKKPHNFIRYWYKPNACNLFLLEPFLLYGKIKNNNKIRHVFEIPIIPKKNIIHPTPKQFEVWYYILNKLKPKSVIDPFLGSGTTAEVCIKLGIPWLGYEINEVYSQDINKRLKNCKKEPKQKEIIEVY